MQWLTAEMVLWTAAGFSLLLLVLNKPVSEIFMSPRRDGSMRFLKVGLYLALALLVLLPGLVLLTGEKVTGTPCGWYLLFFALFCYYLGRNIGMAKGRLAISELMGLDSHDSIEDAQDRLFESRMRHPTRIEVMDSIHRLVAQARQESANAEVSGKSAGTGQRPSPDVPGHSD